MSFAEPIRLVTLAPGHFHAALVQKHALTGVDPHAHVYGPLDDDLLAHVDRITRFNSRPDNPTSWAVDVRAGPDWFERFLAERPGNVVVIAGRNRPKIDLILAAVRAGYSVLADKPWIVEAADFPKLQQVIAEADRTEVLVWDIMTERFEATTQLQRELIHRPDVFGDPLPGTVEEPALELESVHYLSKQVAGVPLRRPAWWFDSTVAGEAMADVGTHLADLATWLLFPELCIDHTHDVEVLHADRWPTRIERFDFLQITGLQDLPTDLSHVTDGDRLTYWGNGSALVRIHDRMIRLKTRWNIRPEGTEGDTHLAVARGSRSTIAVRHEPRMGTGPQVFVTPALGRMADVLAACQAKHEAVDLGDQIHVPIPLERRVGHEAHFSEVLSEFIGYFRNRTSLSAWERTNLLTKYFITTQAVKMAHG